MVYCELNDQYCLDKIKSSFDYDLSSNLSFSDSDLTHLNKPFNSDKIANSHKLKYLNCFRVSAEIFRRSLKFKSREPKRSKMDNFLNKNLSLTNLNDLNRSNLFACKDLSQSDPELYSTNLFSYLDIESKHSQLFFIKTIYSTFKSLNFLKFLKTKNLKKEPNIDSISLSSYESLLDNSFTDNDYSFETFESASLKDDAQIDKSKLIDLKDLKEVEPKENFLNKSYGKVEQMNLDAIDLNQNLSTNDKTTEQPISNLVDLKEINLEPTGYTQFFRLSFIDNFLPKILTSKSHLESKKSETTNDQCENKIAKPDQNGIDRLNKITTKTNTKQSQDEIETIDLNDVNNFEYFKDSFLGSFDLDIAEQEIINYDFDKKLEKFLKQDLERLNKSKAAKNVKKKERFDSIKCLNLFQSKIPVLKRDKTKFSKSMLDKLKIQYDPLKMRNKSKELIEILNEDYEQNKAKSKHDNLKETRSIKSLVDVKLNKAVNNDKLNDYNKAAEIRSRIPRFMCDKESIKSDQTDLLINRKEVVLKAKKLKNKGGKLFKLVKEISSPKDDTKQQEYQYLKRCSPRTKSESFINEQLDTNRINEGFRKQLLDLELKTNGNCLFQLYDYFSDFKEKTKRN